jgi:membrane peptidoglycan carboxypeptidase
LVNIKGVAQVTGGTLPAATWQRFMKRAMAGFPVATFNKPAPITEIVSEAKQSARGGFDIGVRRAPIETDDGGARPADLPPPVATAPTTSTTAPTTTTSLPAPTAPLLNRPTTTTTSP